MKRVLTNCDIPKVEAFLNMRKDTTLFALGNIEQYGLEKEYRGYAWFENTEIVACVFSFMEKYLTVVLKEDVSDHVCEEIKRYIAVTPHEDIAAFDVYFDRLMILAQYPDAICVKIAKTRGQFKIDVKEIDTVDFHILTPDDKEDIDELGLKLADVVEFDRQNVDENRKSYARSVFPQGFTVYAKIDNQIVGAASVTGISKTTAVVVSVWVLAEARQKGIAKQLIHRIHAQFSDGNRTIYIMYRNPIAAQIYLQNGFVEYGVGYIAQK